MTATSTRWRVRPLTGSFGAELSGGSLTDPAATEEISDLLHEHLVLVVRGEGLEPADQVALARRLGEPTPAHPVVPGMPGFPEILVRTAPRAGRTPAGTPT